MTKIYFIMKVLAYLQVFILISWITGYPIYYFIASHKYNEDFDVPMYFLIIVGLLIGIGVSAVLAVPDMV